MLLAGRVGFPRGGLGISEDGGRVSQGVGILVWGVPYLSYDVCDTPIPVDKMMMW